jgi:uncharacterized membrane protein YeaQ/YmgE (transglycosylase-associated protein family)
MTVMSLLWFLLIGLAAGWLASQIMKAGGGDVVTYLIIGVIGALVGGFLFRVAGLPVMGGLGELIAATVGAIILILLLRYLRRV